MPVIQEISVFDEIQAKSAGEFLIDGLSETTTRNRSSYRVVAGLPEAWGRVAYAQLRAALDAGGPKSARYLGLCKLLDEVTAAPLPLDATDAQLCILAQTYANDCAAVVVVEGAEWWPMPYGAGDGVGPREYRRVNLEGPRDLVAEKRDRMAAICRVRCIQAPSVEDDAQAVARCLDAGWWRKQLRKLHGRTFEAAAIRLGMVSSQKANYCSDETVMRRIAQNRRNAQGMASVKMKNVETEQEVSLADLAAKGMGNKKLRRGEMMMRMAGCDKLAASLGHMGIFVTITAPSAYHAVLEKSGAPNPKFNGATPIQTHKYLCNVWTLARAKNDRDGISPYGFRVAEPHHDGCTHWHMLVFMPPEHIETFIQNLSAYALAEDGDEAGAQESRAKFERLDPAKGGAAGYMSKYVQKNIGENEHDTDVFGKPVITPAMRVDAWAGCWGIRQFQPFGQPPVTVYREFRRLEASAVEGPDVPDHIKLAFAACNRVESETEKDADGKPIVLHRADWSEYMIAQGGVKVGKVKSKTRDYSAARIIPYSMKGKKANRGKSYFRGIKTRTKVQPLMSQGRVGGFVIALYAPLAAREGRYGLAVAPKPVGVFCRVESDVIYKSKRYEWKQVGRDVGARVKGVAGGADFDFPWSPVNNCTAGAQAHDGKPMPHWWNEAKAEPVAAFDDVWFSDEGNLQFFLSPGEVSTLPDLFAAAEVRKAESIWTNRFINNATIAKAKKERRTNDGR